MWSFSQATSKSYVRLPNGGTEETTSGRDSNGNSVTSTTRSLGNKSYTVETVVKPDGSQERQETLSGLSEEDLPEFNRAFRNNGILDDDRQRRQQPMIGWRWSLGPSLEDGESGYDDSLAGNLRRNENRSFKSLYERFFGGPKRP